MGRLTKESLFYEEYAKQLEKGIEFTYEEFEKQLREDWMQGYNLAYRFYIFHGTLDIPLDYIIDGFPLGHWIDAQRKQSRALTVNQRKLLDNIHMLWHLAWNHHKLRAKQEIRFGEEQYVKWVENWRLAKDFFEEHGHLNIPCVYVVKLDNGKTFNLGTWLQKQRFNFDNKRLPAERMGKLDSIFAVFDNTNQAEIDRILKVKDHNFLPGYLKGIDPFQERPISVIFNNGHVSHEMRLQRNIGYLRVYFELNDDLNIPLTYSVGLEDGSVINLGTILAYIRKKYREGKLSDEVVHELESMNIVWNPCQKENAESHFEMDEFEKLLKDGNLKKLKDIEQELKEKFPQDIADEVEFEYLLLDEQTNQKGLTKK